ncbi:MAG: hypothetical protein QOE90_3471 [Thermoplasmata archaeon]|nr:hypothetical protein [Thermoplasmata archaeon]
MRSVITFTCVALCAVLCLPAGLAGWGSYGGAEPDTKFDRDQGLMWTSGPDTATDHVYFNGFVNEGSGGAVAINSPTLGSRILGVGEGAYRAILGVWADCNHDGFIGMGDGALIEYRAEVSGAANLPVDPAICPDLPDSAANAGKIHNHGGWITELIPIGSETPTGANARAAANVSNYRLLFDPDLKIWADKESKPETPATPFVPNDHCSSAVLTPATDGDKASHTGGVIQQVVCDESRQGPTPNDLYDNAYGGAPSVVGMLPRPSTLYQDGGPLDKPYPGTEQACKGDPASPPKEPCDSNAFVYGETDCGGNAQTTREHVEDPTGGNVGDVFVNVTTYPVGSPRVNPAGTGPATVNETLSETPQVETSLTGDGDAADSLYLGGGTKCDAESQHSNWIYAYPISTGGAPGDVLAGNKKTPDMVFSWEGPGSRGTCDAQTLWDAFGTGGPDPIPNDPNAVPALNCGQPGSRGLGVNYGEGWFGATNWVNMHPAVAAPSADRSGALPAVQPDTTPAYYVSFYATVGLSGVATPGNAGTYGAEMCLSGIGTGAPNVYGWNCDPASWNVDASGVQSSAPKVGDAYNVRDVDCYDTTVVSASSSANPTGKDIGTRTADVANDPSHACE